MSAGRGLPVLRVPAAIRGAGRPTLTAVYLTVYTDTETSRQWVQIENDSGSGNTWRMLGSGGSPAFGDESVALVTDKGMNREP